MNEQHGASGDGDGRAPELSSDVVALLADPALWAEPPAGLGERVVAGVHSEASAGRVTGVDRTRSSLVPALLGAAAVVVFLFGGLVVFSALAGSDGSDVVAADLVPTGLVADVDGSVELTSFDSGLRVYLHAPSLPRREAGRFYEAWLRTADGSLVPVGTFHQGDHVTMWAGIDRIDVVAFTVTLEEAAPPDSPDQRTSGQVVLKADIPAP